MSGIGVRVIQHISKLSLNDLPIINPPRGSIEDVIFNIHSDCAVGLPSSFTADLRCKFMGLIPHLVSNLLELTDRKSTRLNSSHANISYAVFCLKKKKKKINKKL